jgi:hypothetical protein
MPSFPANGIFGISGLDVADQPPLQIVQFTETENGTVVVLALAPLPVVAAMVKEHRTSWSVNLVKT